MAINKKLIHFKTWNTFISQDGVNGNYSVPSSGSETDGTAVYGQLLGTSIVFIKDVRKIWTHGRLYNCKDPDQTLSESSENTVQNKIVATEFKRVWESIEEESKRKEVIIIDISNEWADGEIHDTGLSFEQYVNSKVIFRILAGPNGESVTCEKISLSASGTSSDDTFYEVYVGRTNLVDIPFVFTVSPIYSNDHVNVGIQYDVNNNFGPILPYVGNGDSSQFLSGDGTWKTVETESEIYNFSFNNWNGKTSYDELNSAYKSGKMICAEGMPALVIPSENNNVSQVLVSLHAPNDNGLLAGLVYLTFTDNGQIQSKVQQVLLENKGSGNLFLSDDGTYKFVETNPFEIPAGGVLPTIGKKGKIYLIPASETTTDNLMYEYVWINDTWEKLGEFVPDVDLGGYYTKEEIDFGFEVKGSAAQALTDAKDYVNSKGFATTAQVDAKQDVISDLATIRTNAAKGATALQSVPEEYITEEELDAKGYSTTSYVDEKIDGKFDTSGAAAAAEQNAKDYADGKFQVKGDYEIAGAATAAQKSANSYTDGKVTSLKTELTETLGNIQTAVTDLESTKLDVEIANTTLATKEEVARKQNMLVSGTNIKTINGENILGLGDIIIDTSVLNSTGTHSSKAMSQKATTDVLNAEINRATIKENELEGRIFAHESITQDAYDTAEYAETIAIDSNERSQFAETTATAAMAAVRTLEGLGNTDTAQTTLASTVAQIEQNSFDIKVLQEMFVLISEEAYEELEIKDPTKIYLMYEE